MTAQQQNYYNVILQHLSQQPTPYQFCLDLPFYSSIFPSVPNGKDRQAIGREMSKLVKGGGQTTINGATMTINFDYIYHPGCVRCGYKDTLI